MIKFNKAFLSGNEEKYIKEAIMNGPLQGNGPFDTRVIQQLQKTLNITDAYLVHSCTAALEIAALAIGISPGDEVIMPSYTYVSTGNAFALRGAKLIFVDVDPKTMCMDLNRVEQAITSKTKVIVPVHYAGFSCDMDRLMTLANSHNIIVVEDAAQSLFGAYKGKSLGTIGHFGCVSCHESKNIHAGGEGGILFVNDHIYSEIVEQIIEKGTNRIEFLNHKVTHYSWKTLGSSYGMSQLNAAFLLAQLESAKEVTTKRIKLYELYYNKLQPLVLAGHFEVLESPSYNQGNGHLFYIKLKSPSIRSEIKQYLFNNGVESVSHYEPLHLSVVGREKGTFIGNDHHTVHGAACLLRLPLHNEVSEKNINDMTMLIKTYFERIIG